MNSIRITLISLIIASSAYAEEIVKFVSLDACKVYYSKSVTPVSGETPDLYCKNRIMNVVEACTANKIAEYVTAQKLKAFTDLSDSEQRSKKTTFAYQCQVSAQNENAGVAMNAANARAAASAALGSSAATSAQQSAANAQMGLQLAQQGTKILDSIGKKTSSTGTGSGATNAAAAEKQNTATGSGSADSKKTADSTPASGSTTASTAASTSSKANGVGDGAKDSPKADTSSNASVDTSVKSNSHEGSSLSKPGELSNEQANKMISDGTNAQKQIAAAGSEVKKFSSGLESEVDGVNSASQVNGDNAQWLKTEISASAEKLNGQLLSNAQNVIQSASTTASEALMDESAAAIQKLTLQVQKYVNTAKNACVVAAEKASLLCVERTSEGAIAAKKLMNASGPILAVVASAQKTCSSTAKITRLVNLGLTAAAGVCVAAKVYCGSTCGTATADLSTLLNEINNTRTLATAEANRLLPIFCSAGATAKVCTSLQKAHPQIIEDLESLTKILSPESTPALIGTTGSMVAKCGSMVEDVVRFGIQAAGAYAAHQNAKACEEKLAASGAANVTTQQYCDKSENVSTQLCVCQKNPMATGCPGAVITDSSASSSSSDKGTNIKGVGGNSAFAGGFGSATKANVGNTSLGKANINGALAGSSASREGSASAPNGFDGGSAGVGGGAGLGGAPSSSAEAALKKEAEEKKKWSFGAFGSDVGGSFGGGSSGTAGSKYKSGALTTGDQAAIQRQIASEKYAAEVSTASGKSNWEKIRNMYLIKENSFIFGQ